MMIDVITFLLILGEFTKYVSTVLFPIWMIVSSIKYLKLLYYVGTLDYKISYNF